MSILNAWLEYKDGIFSKVLERNDAIREFELQ
jgi:hypothetical protein